MVTKEELLKQKTVYETLKEKINNDIDEKLKRIYPDQIQDNIVSITIDIVGGCYKNDLEKILQEYTNNGGYPDCELNLVTFNRCNIKFYL